MLLLYFLLYPIRDLFFLLLHVYGLVVSAIH